MPSRRRSSRSGERERERERRRKSRSRSRERGEKKKELKEDSRTRSRNSDKVKEERKDNERSRNRRSRERSPDRSRERNRNKTGRREPSTKEDDGLNRDFDPRDFHKVMYRRPDEGKRPVCSRWEFNPPVRSTDRRNADSVLPKVQQAFRQNYRIVRKVYDIFNERRYGATRKLLSERFRENQENAKIEKPEENSRERDRERRNRDRSPMADAPFGGRYTAGGFPMNRDMQRGGGGVRGRLGPGPAVPYRPEEEANKPKLLLNDPSQVPKHRAYFDHDERDEDRDRDRGERGGRRGGRGGRLSFGGDRDRGDTYRRFPPFRAQRSAADGMWSHDMYNQEDEGTVP